MANSIDLLVGLPTDLGTAVDTCWAQSFTYTFRTLFLVSAGLLLSVLGIQEVGITDKEDLFESL